MKGVGEERRVQLNNSLRKHTLARECDEMLQAINQQRQLALKCKVQNENESEELNLEQVEKLQRQLDDFQKVKTSTIATEWMFVCKRVVSWII